MTVGLFLLLTAVLLFFGVPVFAALGGSSMAFVLSTGTDALVIGRRFFTGVDSTVLMCIPFFILTGDLMAKGGIADRLIKLSKIAVGRLDGGLSFVCIIACAFFAAITGSNIACCVTMGAILIPAMIENGYSRPYAAAVTCGASILGPIIPPSTLMVIVASITGSSISNLYLLGFPAGIFLAFCYCICAYFICKKRGYKGVELENDERSLKQIGKTVLNSLWALGSPVIILGGIFGGICTPTEASVVAVLYSLIIGLFVYKEIRLQEIFSILLNSAFSTARVLIIISTATLFSFVVTYVGLPNMVLAGLGAIHVSATTMLMITMGILFIMGMFLEPSAIIMIAIPIFLPIVKQYGINIDVFGVLATMVCSLGCITPPFGTVMFAGCHVGEVSVSSLTKELIPFIITPAIVVIILCLFPGLITWIL